MQQVRIIVLLNLMSFFKPWRLQNYTQIFIQYKTTRSRNPVCNTTSWFTIKRKLKWNVHLLQLQSNENLNAKKVRHIHNQIAKHWCDIKSKTPTAVLVNVELWHSENLWQYYTLWFTDFNSFYHTVLFFKLCLTLQLSSSYSILCLTSFCF